MERQEVLAYRQVELILFSLDTEADFIPCVQMQMLMLFLNCGANNAMEFDGEMDVK